MKSSRPNSTSTCAGERAVPVWSKSTTSARNRPSASSMGEVPGQFSLPERTSPSEGILRIAWPIIGNQARCTNQTTVAATSNATMNCTSSSLPNVADANAATPRNVTGCHATGAVSSDSPIGARAAAATSIIAPASPDTIHVVGGCGAGGAGEPGGGPGGGTKSTGTG